MFWGGVAKEPGGVALYIFGCDPAPNPDGRLVKGGYRWHVFNS